MVFIDTCFDNDKYYMDCQFFWRQNKPSYFYVTPAPAPTRSPEPERRGLKRPIETCAETQACKYARCSVPTMGTDMVY